MSSRQLRRANHQAWYCGLVLAALSATPALAADLRVPEDFANFRKAARAAQAGDTILLAPGRYTRSIDIVASNVTILGTDAILTKRLRVRANGVAVRGLAFEGRKSRIVVRGTDFVADGNAFTASKGIRIEGDGATLTDNVASDARRRSGFRVRGQRARVAGNLISGAAGRNKVLTTRWRGLTFSSGGFDFPLGRAIEIVGNEAVVDDNRILHADTGVFVMGHELNLRNCTTSEVGTGYDLIGSNATIQDNLVRSTRRPPFELGTLGFIERGVGFEVRGHDNLMVDNLIESCEQRGVRVEGSDNRIADNEVRASEWAAITVDGHDNKVVGNEVRFTRQGGLEISGNRVLVELNSVTSCEYDGFIVSGNENVIRSNFTQVSVDRGFVIEGNTCQLLDNTVGTSRNAGLFVRGQGHLIRGNGIVDAGGAGLDIIGGENRVLSNQATRSHYSGFRVEGDDNTLRGNNVGAAGYYGFEVVGNGNTLTGNTPGTFDPRYGDYDLDGNDNVVQ